MKTRNGFVSNSSSSSFIVNYRDWACVGHEKPFLTSEQVKKLINYGFIPSSSFNLLEIMIDFYGRDKKGKLFKALKSESKEFTYNYIYYVDCNQNDVIEFLLKNDIPFKALTNYGCQVVIYKDQKIFNFDNEGIEREMYGNLGDVKKFESNPYLKGKKNENKKRVRK